MLKGRHDRSSSEVTTSNGTYTKKEVESLENNNVHFDLEALRMEWWRWWSTRISSGFVQEADQEWEGCHHGIDLYAELMSRMIMMWCLWLSTLVVLPEYACMRLYWSSRQQLKAEWGRRLAWLCVAILMVLWVWVMERIVKYSNIFSSLTMNSSPKPPWRVFLRLARIWFV